MRTSAAEADGREECWRRLLAAVGGWRFNGFGTWAVERKADGKLVGNAACSQPGAT
jgi:hypothetical protein